MIALQYAFDFNASKPSTPRRRRHYVLAALAFFTAYFVTVTVHAQDAVPTAPPVQGEITLGSDKTASVTGTVVEADENWVLISSAGRDMRIMLDKVNMKSEADNIFTPGMTVLVDGRMTGESFGVLVMQAETITASATQAVPQAVPVR